MVILEFDYYPALNSRWAHEELRITGGKRIGQKINRKCSKYFGLN